MIKIRKGLDVDLAYTIMRVSGPEDLTTARGITVRIINIESPSWVLDNTFHVVDGNVVKIHINGGDIHQDGEYRLVIYYTKHNPDREPHDAPFTIDTKVFEIVPYSDLIGGDCCPELEISQIKLTGTIHKCSDGAPGSSPEIGVNGNWLIGGIDTGVRAQGATGKSAYQFAVDGGYEGTEEQFNNGLSSVEDKVKLTPQKLTTKQQTQVHTNIGTQAIADMAAKQLFIDMWNTRCGRLGRYNAESGFFELSEVTDITYERAKMIMLYSNGYGSNAALQAGISTRLYVENMIDYPVDINLPAYSNWNGSKNYSLYLYGSNVKILLLEAVNTFPGADSSNCYLSSSFTGYTMYSSRTTRIIGIINMNNVTATTIMEGYGEKLEQISLNRLHQNYNISSWVKINNPSVEFMISNAKTTPDFTITVAPDVYTRAIVDPAIIAALAAKPNITLASA